MKDKKMKKKSDVSVLLGYAGKYKVLTVLGLILSAVAMILGMAPYICIWLVARDLIAVAPNWSEAINVSPLSTAPSSKVAATAEPDKHIMAARSRIIILFMALFLHSLNHGLHYKQIIPYIP